MILSTISWSLFALSVALLLNYVISSYRFGKKYKLPAEVSGWPIIGNTLDVPFPGGMWGKKMADKYGEMYTCRIGGRIFVYLNSSRVVTDLLEKRASIYSSRPWRPNAADIMCGGRRILLLPYGDQWRNQRKIMHSILNGRQADLRFAPYQELEAKQLVYDYLKTPEKFHLANQRYSNSVVCSVVFGRRAELHDAQLQEMLRQMRQFGQYLFHPIKNIYDVFPKLSYIPRSLQWWRPHSERTYQATLDLYRHEWQQLLERIENGTARPCFAVEVIEGAARKEFVIDEEEKLMVFSSLIEAGSDTSRTAITQMVAAAAVYPDWVKTAQAYLDQVCGYNAERLPRFADKEKLPYITAVVKETLRWRPFIQTGFPHMLTQDDEYEGYRFPAGTQFTWNAYAISLNENDYKDPTRFMPERYLNNELDSALKGHWAFGTGRRVCVGYNVGATNVWIAAACILYCFDFQQDPTRPIDTFESDWDSDVRPPFTVKVKPRSAAHVKLIELMGREAMETSY